MKKMTQSRMFQALLLVIVAALAPARLSAYDFEADGICYNVNEDQTTVSVTYKVDPQSDVWHQSDTYSGDVVIPSQVTHDGKTYTVTEIGEYAFSLSPITSVTLPETISAIGEEAFSLCYYLTAIDFPELLTSIGDYAFCATSLRSVTIPDLVTHLGEGCFCGCVSLKEVTIGQSVGATDDDTMYFVFLYSEGLERIFCKSPNPPLLGSACDSDGNYYYNFDYVVSREARLIVPCEAKDAYMQADEWKEFRHILSIGASLYDINGDGEVNIADVNAMIDAVLSQNCTILEDVNFDGEVNLADVNTVISAVFTY